VNLKKLTRQTTPVGSQAYNGGNWDNFLRLTQDCTTREAWLLLKVFIDQPWHRRLRRPVEGYTSRRGWVQDYSQFVRYALRIGTAHAKQVLLELHIRDTAFPKPCRRFSGHNPGLPKPLWKALKRADSGA
jgi:hypothetical protein